MRIVLIIIAFIAALFMVFLTYYDFFYEVKIEKKAYGPVWLVYNNHIGSYQKSADLMNSIFYDLYDKYQIKTTRGFGLYYDDPKLVKESDLRSIAGCLLDETPDSATISRLSQDFKIRQLQADTAIYSEFPFKGRGSVVIGIFKVYPKFGQVLMEENREASPVMEVYDQPNGIIQYVAPLTLSRSDLEGYMK